MNSAQIGCANLPYPTSGPAACRGRTFFHGLKIGPNGRGYPLSPSGYSRSELSEKGEALPSWVERLIHGGAERASGEESLGRTPAWGLGSS